MLSDGCSNTIGIPLLSEITPLDGDWAPADNIWFSNRVVDRQFVSHIKKQSYSEKEGVMRVGVSLVDTSHPSQDKYVEKELVDNGKAVYSR